MPSAATQRDDAPSTARAGERSSGLSWILRRFKGDNPPAVPSAGDAVQAVLGAVESAILVVSPNDRIEAASAGVEALTGYSPQGLVGKGMAQTLFPPADRDVAQSRLHRLADGGEDPTPFSLLHASGDPVPAALSVQPVAGSASFLVKAETMAPDEHKAALDASEHRRRTLRLVLDSLPAAVVAVDRSGKVVFQNRTQTERFGTDAGLSSTDWREAIAVMRGGTPVLDREEADPSGGVRLSSRVPVADRNGAVMGLVSISRDVTKQKETEAELLERQRTAEAAAKANSEMLATTSHEIRTLLSGVTGMTSLLLDTTLDEDQRDFVDTIRTSSGTLLAVVNDVLDLSKMDAGMLSLEERPYDVRRLLKNALTVVRQQAEAKGLDLSADVADDVPQIVTGDAMRVQQVLANLLTNAVKFTETGSVHVSIATGPPALGGESVLAFSVKDTGVGIAPERLDAIFERYTQADDSIARTYGGTGLGLAICRRLVEMMGGELTAESRTDGGSVFQFTVIARAEPGTTSDGSIFVDIPIPGTATNAEVPEAASPTAVESAEAPSASPATAPTKPLSVQPNDAATDAATPPREPQGQVMSMDSMLPSARVLLVEDDPVMQKVTALTLRRLGYLPTVVGNGAKAVTAVRGRPYDLVLMDIMMPVMDGLEATRQIREDHGPHPEPAIVALTANALGGDRERCLEAGCDDYLSKPVAPRELATTLEKAMRQRKAGQA
ncbi:MAG: ATP-binding protein [Bacteroidota bacterium]